MRILEAYRYVMMGELLRRNPAVRAKPTTITQILDWIQEFHLSHYLYRFEAPPTIPTRLIGKEDDGKK